MNRTIYRNFAIAITAVICAVIFAGCSTGSKSAKTPKLSDIEAAIGKQMKLSEMIKLDDDKLTKVYGIDPSELSEYSVYISDSNAQADELALVKAKDPKNTQKLMDLVSKRIDSQSEGFKDYIPDEYNKLQKHVLKDQNGYILMVVSNDSDKIEDIFDGFFK